MFPCRTDCGYSVEPASLKQEAPSRIDTALVERGLAPSREKAAVLVMAGEVYVNTRRALKCSEKVKPEDEITVKYEAEKYVSRGGHKLEQALKEFGIDPTGKTAMDVGASTGGFTDCLLRFGAGKVVAVDVGTNQLDWKLRNDPRVISMEKSNFRYLELPEFPEGFDIITVDLSFISLNLIFPKLKEFLKPDGDLVCLVKPQFEAGKGGTKKGAVTDPDQRRKILEKVTREAAVFFPSHRVIESGTPGKKKKNIEYLVHLRNEVMNELTQPRAN